MNVIYNRMNGIEPKVGLPATEICYSDRHAGRVVEVAKNGRRLVWQQDTTRRIDSNGFSDAQSYEYEPNPFGRKVRFSRRKDGRWLPVGVPSGNPLIVGMQNEYYDFSF